jgi:hypothetical protein
MLDSIITSQTRIKLLLKFFLNPGVKAYLREIASEFGESTNGIRLELNHLTKAQVLHSEPEGRTILYSANLQHPFFCELSDIVRKMVGFDKLIEKVLNELKGLEKAFITGDYAEGRDTGLIDLVLVGAIDANRAERLTKKVENLICRKIRTLILTQKELNILRLKFDSEPALVLWEEQAPIAVD